MVRVGEEECMDLSENKIEGYERDIGEIHIPEAEQEDWHGWTRIARIPIDFDEPNNGLFLPVFVREPLRRGLFRQSRGNPVLRIDSHRHILNFHFIALAEESDPLGAIPPKLINQNLEQIVVGIPYWHLLEVEDIWLVVQLPFEKVWNFESAPTA